MRTRILSIDPGSTTCGLAITEYDEVTGECFVVDAHTIHLDKLVKHYYPNELVFYGEKFTKIIALKDSMLRILEAWKPDHVVSEGPYMGSFVTTFASLTTCVVAIRFALREYSTYMDVTVIDPATVKKSLMVSGKSGDKELIRKAIKGRALHFIDVDIDKIDEHSVDAIAVGQCYLTQFIKPLRSV